MTREEALLSVTEADFKALCERWKTGYATPEDIELLRLFETSPSGGRDARDEAAGLSRNRRWQFVTSELAARFKKEKAA